MEEKIEIWQQELDEIRLALYYTQNVHNLTGNHRSFITIAILADALGFKLSDDSRSLIIPDMFVIKGSGEFGKLGEATFEGLSRWEGEAWKDVSKSND